MAKIAVPTRHKRAINGLFSLTDVQVKQLRADIDASDGKYPTLVELLQRYVEKPGAALTAMASLRIAVREFDLTDSDLREALLEVAESDKGSVDLVPLIKSPIVGRFAKALELRNAYERILTSSRVITDVRPVFPDDDQVSEIADAAMVNHTLKLSFYTAHPHGPNEIYVALDASDLTKLKDQIDRALEKERASRALIEQGGAVVLEPLDPDD